MAVIMVVDDEQDVISMLEDYLQHHGYTVVTAEGAREALDTLRERKPDLMISDIHMPEMSGYALCGAIKDEPGTKHIPVILLSGVYGSEEDALLAHRFGASFFVTKPFSLDELHVKIKQLLEP